MPALAPQSPAITLTTYYCAVYPHRYKTQRCEGCDCAAFTEVWESGRSQANKRLMELMLRFFGG